MIYLAAYWWLWEPESIALKNLGMFLVKHVGPLWNCSSVPRVWPSGTGPKTARKCWTLQHLTNLCEVVTLGHLVGCKCWVALKADIWGHGTVAMWQLVAGYKINNELRLFAEPPITELRKELSKAFEHMDEPFLEATHLAAGHVSALSRPTGWILHCYIRHDAPWLRHDTPLLPIFCQLSKSQSVWIQDDPGIAKKLKRTATGHCQGYWRLLLYLSLPQLSSVFIAFLRLLVICFHLSHLHHTPAVTAPRRCRPRWWCGQSKSGGCLRGASPRPDSPPKSPRSAMTAWLVIGERTTTNDSYKLIGIPERARTCTIRTSVGRQVLPISFASLHKTCADLSRTILKRFFAWPQGCIGNSRTFKPSNS